MPDLQELSPEATLALKTAARTPPPRVRRDLLGRDHPAIPRHQLRPVRRSRHRHQLPPTDGRTIRPAAPARAGPRRGHRDDGVPIVLFLCVHNAGRSQMALGWFNHLAGDRAIAWSGGSEPASEVNPAAVAAMAEVGIDIVGEFPKPWTDEIVRAADVVVTMGCGDACPIFPGKRYDDWVLDDPAGLDLDAVRPIRDEIGRRVKVLLENLTNPRT